MKKLTKKTLSKKISAIITCLILIILCSSCSKNLKLPTISSGYKEINKGTFLYKKGCYKNALLHYFKANEYFSISDYADGIAISMNNIGNIYRITGNSNDAINFFDESYRLYEEIGNYSGAIYAISNKAATYIGNKDFKNAEKTIKLAEEIEKQHNLSFSPLLCNKGILLTMQKKYERAEKVLKKALDLTNKKNTFQFATANYAMGRLMLATNQINKAENYFEIALNTDKNSGYSQSIAQDLEEIGLICIKQKKFEKATQFFIRSVKIFSLLGDSNKVNKLMPILEDISQKAKINILITKYFISQWLAGDSLTVSCK